MHINFKIIKNTKIEEEKIILFLLFKKLFTKKEKKEENHALNSFFLSFIMKINKREAKINHKNFFFYYLLQM